MENYLKKMENYSGLGSWAIWKSIRKDGSFQKEQDLDTEMNFEFYVEDLQKSNTVFLAMNPGGEFNEEEAKQSTRKIKDCEKKWNNFHNIGRSRDYLLAEAIKDTPEIGSYMTDVFPIAGSNSSIVKKFINAKENADIVNRLILEFDEEMSLLDLNNIRLLCLGKSSFDWVNKFLIKSEIPLKNSYRAFYLPHYSGANNGGIKKMAEKLGVENYYPAVVKKLLEQYRNN